MTQRKPESGPPSYRHRILDGTMLSTLYAHAEVPDRDAHLMLRLGQQLKDTLDHSTASLYRFAIANDSGALYRLVIIFGHSERGRAVELLHRLGYRQHGPDPERGLDAVFHPPGPGA